MGPHLIYQGSQHTHAHTHRSEALTHTVSMSIRYSNKERFISETQRFLSEQNDEEYYNIAEGLNLYRSSTILHFEDFYSQLHILSVIVSQCCICYLPVSRFAHTPG